MDNLRSGDFLLLIAPLLLVGMPYYLLSRFRKKPLSIAMHYAFRVTLVILLVWAAWLFWVVGTGDGWSRLVLLGWIFGVVPVIGTSLVVTWAVLRLARPPAGASAAGRYFAWAVVAIATLATTAYVYRENALLATARDVNTDEATLRSLSSSVFAEYDRGLLETIAFNQTTPVDVLERLARHPDYNIRIKVCNNRETPTSVLEILSRDTVLYTKPCVAAHPNVSPDLLARMARDENKSVKYRVAENSKTPVNSLRQLASDADTFTRKALAANPALPLDVLQTFSSDDDEFVRMFVARHPNATREMRMEYATDPSNMVRQALIEAGKDDVELLTILSRDEDKNIRHSAQHRINQLGEKK